jgi:phosphate starvation-inducible protein PhoH and related proteins
MGGVTKILCAKRDFSMITPKNGNQKRYMDLLHRDKPYIVVAAGSAGSGKTLLGVTVGVNKLIAGDVDRIVVTRPAVSVDEQHGFLPGDLDAKMHPWIRPIHDVLRLHFPVNKVEHMIKDKIVDIVPLAYMRGITFENSWVICDEAQNTTVNQMQMILTRIGKGSKMVITGDPSQYDRGYHVNGLSDLLQRLDYKSLEEENEIDDMIEAVSFVEEDVERHEVIKHVLELYKAL